MLVERNVVEQRMPDGAVRASPMQQHRRHEHRIAREKHYAAET